MLACVNEATAITADFILLWVSPNNMEALESSMKMTLVFLSTS